MSSERNRIVRAIVEGLVAQGWKVRLSGGHYRCVPPVRSAAMVTIGTTLSDHRAVKNILSQLRHSGADTSKLPKG